MKKLKRVGSYYQGSFLVVLLLMTMLTFVLFYMTTAVGVFSVNTEAVRLYRNARLEGSLYFMPSGDLNTGETEIDAETITGFPAVRDIVAPLHGLLIPAEDRNNIINVTICSDAYLDAFQMQKEGKWLTPTDAGAGTAGSGSVPQQELEAVVAGYTFSDTKIGELLSFWEPESNQTVELRVVGKQNEPAYSPSFGAGGVEIGPETLITQAHNAMYITEETARYIFGDGYDEYGTLFGGFIRTKPQVSAAEKQELVDYLSQNGAYLTYEQIMEQAQVDTERAWKEHIVMPLLLLLVCTVAFVSLTVLISHKRLVATRTFFLCGYTKRECCTDFFATISLIVLVPGILCSAFVCFFPAIYHAQQLYRFWPDGKIIVDGGTLVMIWGYLLLCLLFSVFLTTRFLRKSSPMELYRREV